MPSPFPGMDPYLESPDVWPDVHQRLATEISNELNNHLPGAYYARLEMRPEISLIHEVERPRTVVPDVAVVRRSEAVQPGGVAILEGRRTRLSEPILLETETVHHHFVEIRDSTRNHALVTLIEILSPANKRPGPDREAYRRKQSEILGSTTSLVEIDLLRSGARILPEAALSEALAELQPPPAYLVLVNRSWRRGEEVRQYQLDPVGLREWLPCVGIPLVPEIPDVPLDLQYTFQRLYDSGPYRRGAVDYSRAPVPPLEGEDAAWAETLLGRRAAE